MKLKIRYENDFQIIELDAEATEKLWISLSITTDEEISQIEKEKLIQEAWNEGFNKPEYNIYHKETRHLGYAMSRDKDGFVEYNPDEALIGKLRDNSIFTKDADKFETQQEYEGQNNDMFDILNENLKPKQVEMVIAIALDGLTVAEYAEQIGDKPNNVSHRYRRALNKLKKFF